MVDAIRMKILEESTKKTAIKTQYNTAEDDIDIYTKELELLRNNKDSELNDMRDEYIDEQKRSINETYHDEILNLENELENIDLKISDSKVEDDEEVLLLRERMKYLNQVAIEIERLYETLLSVSQKEFIDYASTTKTISFEKYTVELGKIDSYISQIEKYRHKDYLLEKLATSMADSISVNITTYVVGAVTGLFSAFYIPKKFIDAVNRAKALHRYSRIYSILLTSSVDLKDKTSEEIISSLEKVLVITRKTLQEQYDEVFDKLLEKQDLVKTEIDDIEFDESEYLDEVDSKEKYFVAKLKTSNDNFIKYGDELKVIEELINKLQQEFQDALEKEREPYINPSNISKSNIHSEKFLYDYTKEANIWMPIKSGLYIYDERYFAEQLIRLLTFELRNYLNHQAVGITVYDTLMASYIDDLMSDRLNNLQVDSLKKEFEDRIDLMNDLLRRRKSLIGSVSETLIEYNRLQDTNNSVPTSFEFMFLFFDSPQQLSEKLIQLIKVGYNMGIIVLLFVKSIDLTESVVKMYDKYIDVVIELSGDGMSSTTLDIYRKKFDKKPQTL